MAVVPKQSGIDILRNLIPLNTLSDDSLERLLVSAKFSKVRKGETLFTEGDEEVARVYLISGSVALTEQGEEAYKLSAGDNMARYPLAHHIPRKYSAIAKNRVEIVVLDNTLLGDLLAASSNSSYDVEEVDGELTDDWMSKLLKSPIFQQLPAASIQQVMMHMDEFLVVAGQAVIQEGEAGDFFYLVNSGTALVTRAGGSGAVEELARLEPGATFGEESLLSDSSRSSTVTMLTDGVLLRLDKARFVEYVKAPLADTIEYKDAVSKAKVGAVWIDVRTEKEHIKGHIPSSLSIPFNRLRSRLSELDASKSYIAYCQDGMVSATAVYLLMNAGFEAYTLSRGVESVPASVLSVGADDNSAQIISIRPEEPAEMAPQPITDDLPEDEASLLRQQLHSTEDQVKEQILHAQKMKLLINKLKANLATVEEDKAASLRAQAQQEAQLDELAGKLKELEKGRRSDKKQLKQGAQHKQELDKAWLDLEQAKAEQTERGLVADKDIAQLTLQLTELKRALSQAEDDATEQQRQNDQYKADAESFQRKLQEADDFVQRAQKEGDVDREVAQSHQDGLTKELEQLKSELVSSNSALASAQASIDAQTGLEGELSALKQSFDAAKEVHQQSLQEVERLGGVADEAEKQQRLKSDEIGERSKEVAQLTAEREELNAQHEALQNERDGLQETLEEQLRSQQDESKATSDLNTTLDQLRVELNEKSTALDAATQQQTDDEKANSDLTQTVEQLRAELSEKSAALEAANQQQADEVEASTARNETIEQLRAELSEKSAALEAATQQQADEGEVSTARNETIEQLRAELSEKSAALEATTQQQADEGEVNTALNETIEQLRAELSEKSVALDAATQQQVDNEKANTDLAQTVDQLRAELSEKSAVLNDAAEVALQSPASSATAGDQSRLAVLEAELKTLNEVLDDADGDYDALKQKYEKLEQQLSESVSDSREKDLAVMEQALSQANAKADSLQEDLQRADSEAKRETSAITEQLKEAELKAKERQLNGEADAAENEVLRQEKSALTLSLSEHKGDLELSRKESALLEERIEERNSEVDRLNSALQIAQDELSTSQFDKQAAVEAKESSEQIFNTLQQEIESGQYKADMVDPRINVETLESSSGSRNRSALLAPLMAAVVAFGVADLLSIMAGKGELIGGLIGDERVVVRPSESTFEADPSADDLVAEVPLVTDADWAKSAQQPVAEVAIEPAKTILPTTIKPVGKPVKPSQRVVTVTESEERGPTVVEPTSRAAPAELIRIEPQSAAVPEVKFTPPPTVGPPSGTVVRDRLRSGGQAPEMVYLQGSTFTMGSDRSQLASEERPAHSVSLNNFLIGRHEVTYLEYSQFTQITGRSLPSDLGWGKGNRPVINVSWDDANEYALWLSEQTGKRYRLPTEAEWEYAAAAGTDTLYWWGFQLGDGQANCFNCGSNWDGQSTAPVGAFKANAFGIHNTAGNVMEWVSDCYHDSYRGAPSDGSAWQEQGCRQRVVRGGAFNKPGDSLRTTRRGAHDADTRLFVLGFRLARDASGK